MAPFPLEWRTGIPVQPKLKENPVDAPCADPFSPQPIGSLLYNVRSRTSEEIVVVAKII
jgi:hypothetical protein